MAKEKKKALQQSEELQKQKKILRFNSESEEEESKPKRNFSWIVIVIILLCLGAGGFWLMNRTQYYNDFELLSVVENSDATQMSYLAYNGSLVKYSKDGITYLDKAGNAVWMESYKMKQPMVVVSDEYVAVADLNGNSVYIFNAGGKVSAIETPYTICNLDVADQGVFAVVLENESENFIELYDKNGKNLVNIRTTIADSGYPLDIALSDDGSKMVSSYVTVEGLTLKNSIAAYNFGEVGQNETDRLVGGFQLEGTIVPKVEFLNNDTICAFGDNQFRFYSMREKPSEKGIIDDFSKEIQSIFYNSRYVGIVEKGTGEENALYYLRVFDTNGNERFSKALNFTYNNIYATEEEIIIVGNAESRIYSFQGNLKFSYSFPREVNNIVPTGSPQRYIVVYDDTTEIIKLRYTKEDDEKVQ
ncbi:MAG: hypothetical protein K2N24_10820 [Lachnospiraceae bacterium]|nr:hypothetical protein [Lachnospiraceae bacterium]